MKEPVSTTRDIARELARRFSTMTHEELDILESVLVPMRFAKGEMILREGEVCRNIYYIEKDLCGSSTSRKTRTSRNIWLLREAL